MSKGKKDKKAGREKDYKYRERNKSNREKTCGGAVLRKYLNEIKASKTKSTQKIIDMVKETKHETNNQTSTIKQ